MILEAYACSDVGVERTGNEDNLYFNGLVKGESDGSFTHYEKMNVKKSRAVFGVFDGMGGYANGEHAAYITADTAKKILKENKKGDPQELLNRISVDSNTAICEEIKNNSGQRMGSTLSMVYFEGTHFTLCNIGDSPVYLMRKGELKLLSQEHTEAAVYTKIYGEAPPKGKKFPLTQHIGISENPDRLTPFLLRENVSDGDIFLICSDGLTDMLDDAEILRIVNSSRPISGIGKILLNNSLDHGGKDNITFILVKVSGVGEQIVELPKRTPIQSDTKPKSNTNPSYKVKPKNESKEINNSKQNSNKKPQAVEKTTIKAEPVTSKQSSEKKQVEENSKDESKGIRKVIIGTVILIVIAAVASFMLKDYYISSNTDIGLDNSLVDVAQEQNPDS